MKQDPVAWINWLDGSAKGGEERSSSFGGLADGKEKREFLCSVMLTVKSPVAPVATPE